MNGESHFFEDIGFAVVVERGEGGGFADFKVYDWPGGLKQADCVISGNVKHDGCVNINTVPSGVLLHTCSEQQLKNVGEVLLRCRNIAKGLLGGDDWDPIRSRHQQSMKMLFGRWTHKV